MKRVKLEQRRTDANFLRGFFFSLVVAEHRHAAPVDGRQPARIGQMLRVRQDMRLRTQVKRSYQYSNYTVFN